MDIPLVHRLSEQGIVFHTRSALIQDIRPLREALVNMLIGGQYPTYVWKGDKGEAVGFAQLRQDKVETHAHILCLGGSEEDEDRSHNLMNEDAWVAFLEQLIAQAGKKGIQTLIAEVDELGDELPVLRHAGFAVYTRQDIWKLDKPDEVVKSNLKLTKATEIDEWDISLLYANIVPRLIQLVEPAPSADELENIWVLREDNEIAAFVNFTDGPAATWLRIFVHPNAHTRGKDILKAALDIAPPKPNHPVYCCVRRYQSWVQTSLESVGFKHDSSQAMMVRHTVQHTRKLVPEISKEMAKKAVAARRNWFIESQEPDSIHQIALQNNGSSTQIDVSTRVDVDKTQSKGNSK